jgi:hypothetical protein
LTYEDEFFVNNPPDIKENYEHALDVSLYPSHLFLSDSVRALPMGGLLLCLSVITVNPALVTSDIPGQEGCTVGGDLMKLLADVDKLLLLISCQNSVHKFGSEKMHAKFSCQNLLACSITDSNLVFKVLNCSMSILMNELLKSGYSVGVVELTGLPVSNRPQTKHAIQTHMYISCFHPLMLVKSLLRSLSHSFLRFA